MQIENMTHSEIILFLNHLRLHLTSEHEDETILLHFVTDFVAKEQCPKNDTILRIIEELTKEKNYRLLLRVVFLFQSMTLKLLNKEEMIDFCGKVRNIDRFFLEDAFEVFCLKHNVDEEELWTLFILNMDNRNIVEILGLKEEDEANESALANIRMETMSLLRTCGYETLGVKLGKFKIAGAKPEDLEVILNFCEEYNLPGSISTLTELLRREMAKDIFVRKTFVKLVGIFSNLNAHLLQKKRWLQMIKVKILIENSPISSITYLRNDEVLKWIFFDTSFLKNSASPRQLTKKELKAKEDIWGKKFIGKEEETMWTGIFGECIAKEIFLLHDFEVTKPKKISGMQLDWLVSSKESCDKFEYLVEVKTQTFYTTGTAGEKILSVPLKYACIGMPLKIISIANIEKLMREDYQCLPEMGVSNGLPKEKRKIIQSFEENCIFIGATDLLVTLSDKIATYPITETKLMNKKRLREIESGNVPTEIEIESGNVTESDIESFTNIFLGRTIFDLTNEEPIFKKRVVIDLTYED